ncbi:MAG: hypothetical protein H8E98_06105 [Bacteroidetes bacterium]|nr:hypothetical protein [Bacteroidota bacterium]
MKLQDLIDKTKFTEVKNEVMPGDFVTIKKESILVENHRKMIREFNSPDLYKIWLLDLKENIGKKLKVIYMTVGGEQLALEIKDGYKIIVSRNMIDKIIKKETGIK